MARGPARSTPRSSRTTLGVPFEWITNDNTNTDSSAVCNGQLRLAGDVHRGQRCPVRSREGARADPRDRVAGVEIDPSDLDVIEGEVIAKGAPDRKISVPEVRRPRLPGLTGS